MYISAFDKDNCDEDDCLKTIKENMKMISLDILIIT